MNMVEINVHSSTAFRKNCEKCEKNRGSNPLAGKNVLDKGLKRMGII